MLAQLGENNQALVERNAALEKALADERASSRLLQEELTATKSKFPTHFLCLGIFFLC